MHSCGSFHTASTNTNSHRNTNSTQPYGQIMRIMRNTSGGTNNVGKKGGRKSGRRDAMRQKWERKKGQISKLRLKSKDMYEWERERSSYSKWVQTEQINCNPRRGSDFSHLLLWLNPTCEKHYPALVVNLGFISMAWCHQRVRVKNNIVTEMSYISGKTCKTEGNCFCWNHVVILHQIYRSEPDVIVESPFLWITVLCYCVIWDSWPWIFISISN